jgi:hypothetical protein
MLLPWKAGGRFSATAMAAAGRVETLAIGDGVWAVRQLRTVYLTSRKYQMALCSLTDLGKIAFRSTTFRGR